MRKATTNKTSPATLGNKHSCTECGTKFYDFGKPDLVCPKCRTKVDTDAKTSRPTESRRKKETPEEALMEAEDVVVSGESEDTFESLEEIDDDEDDVAEDIDVNDEKEDF